MKWVLVAALVMGGPALAGDKGLPKVGAHPAQPEVTVAFDKRMNIAARLIIDRSGDPAAEVTKAVQIRFEMGLEPVEGAKPGDVRLTCRIAFVKADGTTTAPARDHACYAGPVAAVEVDTALKFRPGRDDPAGATGVLLIVRDEITKKERKVMATYGWMPEG
jgi:hypothetical protein